MSYFVYIIYSCSFDKFYIGQTQDLNRRLRWHNSKEFKQAYTSPANDWDIFWSLKCPSREVALKIENYIKAMRNRKYYNALKYFNKPNQNLIDKFF